MSSIKEEFLSRYESETLSPVELPGQLSGLYTVEACLKDTKEKQTYLLRGKADGKPALLKRAVRFFRGELETEYFVLSALRHACLPQVSAFFEEGQYAYLLREYIPGESLHSLVERRGPLPERQAVETAISACDCLSFLHSRKPPVIHRDIKPQNIIITPDGRLALIDLGAARLYKQDALQDTVFMGTVATAAPEQYGFGQTDARCDIYAIGMLILYLLTGEFRTDADALRAIPKPLRSIVSKCLEIDPKRRYASAGALKAALGRFLSRRARHISAGIAVGFCAAAMLAAILMLNGAAARQAALGVKFTSPLIEKAVRLELDKPEGPILPEELLSVQQLTVCGNTVITDLNKFDQYCDLYTLDGKQVETHGGIVNLGDLRGMKNLKTLMLDRQSISDLSPLKGLPLQTLELSSNEVVDLTPLKQCATLTKLNVNANPVKDITPLASLENLESLDISFTTVTDLSPIVKLPIRELDMFEVPLGDYAPLKQFASLESLGTRFVPEKGLQVIGSLTPLKSLAVLCCGIKDLQTLAALTNLESLNLNSNRITDLSKVGNFPKLRYLDVCNNPVQSLEPLKKLLQLGSVNIANSNVPDLSVLLELPCMQYVNCDKAQAQTLNGMGVDLPFNLAIQ